MAIPDSSLDPCPDVRVFFSGLMILDPSDDNQHCEVFVHRSAPNHQLTIEVREKQKQGPDLIKMRHVGPLPYALAPPDFEDDPPIHGMSILVNTNSKGIRAYRGKPSEEGEALDLAINLDGEDFHNGASGKIDELNARPSILLNDAVLYTADKTSPDLSIDLKKHGQLEPVKALQPFASLIGGNIYLDEGDSVIVKWMVQGLLEELKLTKSAKGNSYEIYIVNDPLYESDTLLVPAHDEFKEYYKLLPDIALENQFRLEVKLKDGVNPPVPDRGSTKTPCMAVIVAGP